MRFICLIIIHSWQIMNILQWKSPKIRTYWIKYNDCNYKKNYGVLISNLYTQEKYWILPIVWKHILIYEHNNSVFLYWKNFFFNYKMHKRGSSKYKNMQLLTSWKVIFSDILKYMEYEQKNWSLLLRRISKIYITLSDQNYLKYMLSMYFMSIFLSNIRDIKSYCFFCLCVFCRFFILKFQTTVFIMHVIKKLHI